MTEKAFQALVTDWARLRKWKYYHTHDSRRSPAGFPDLVLARSIDSRIVYAELKSEKGVLSTDQEEWVDLLKICGQEIYVWRPSDWDEIQLRLL